MKKISNARFEIRRRGYDVSEVENYIVETQSKNETVLIEQKERIAALKEENDKLTAEVTALRAQENQIKLTLLKATHTAEQLDSDLKNRYAAELKRLQLFRAKWTSAYEEIRERYNFSKDALNMESVAVQTEIELKKFLKQNFSLANGREADEMEEYFKKEVDRLTKLQQAAQNSSERQGENIASDNVFSIDEALHPKESLEDLCKDLGIAKKACRG
ncbi:MAG: DivIVA domain-containing protein [Clostridia bacterium]|nr:DivIVA domain-containing protein [Clostridia bacterium]